MEPEVDAVSRQSGENGGDFSSDIKQENGSLPQPDDIAKDASADQNSPAKTKSQLKKERKFERLRATYALKRAKEKADRKRKKLEARQKKVAEEDGKPILSRKQERRALLKKMQDAMDNGVRLCVDMSFADIMSPKEIGQLASQICFMYATNKKMEKPFSLHLTSFQKGTKLHDEVVKRCSGFENYKIRKFEEPLENLFPPSDIVYMSPDSPNVLEEVDPKKVYVIGGLVDGTPKKAVSLNRATDIGCQTARLPIKEYMTRVAGATRNTILTLNQVYEILMLFHQTKSWEAALAPCVPQRKGFKLKNEATGEPSDAKDEEMKTETEATQADSNGVKAPVEETTTA